jgi:hypothetical protein
MLRVSGDSPLVQTLIRPSRDSRATPPRPHRLTKELKVTRTFSWRDTCAVYSFLPVKVYTHLGLAYFKLEGLRRTLSPTSLEFIIVILAARDMLLADPFFWLPPGFVLEHFPNKFRIVDARWHWATICQTKSIRKCAKKQLRAHPLFLMP